MPPKTTDATATALAKIAEWKDPYRDIGERIHRVILDTVPELAPKMYYGAPGYAIGGKPPVLIFFRLDDDTFSLGLTEKAHHEVEEGSAHQLMQAAWVLTGIDDTTEARIAEIVRRAVRRPGNSSASNRTYRP